MFVPNDVSDFRSGGHQSSGRNCFLVSFANCFVLLFCLFCFWKTRLLRLSPRVISPYLTIPRVEARDAPGGPLWRGTSRGPHRHCCVQDARSVSAAGTPVLLREQNLHRLIPATRDWSPSLFPESRAVLGSICDLAPRPMASVWLQ